MSPNLKSCGLKQIKENTVYLDHTWNFLYVYYKRINSNRFNQQNELILSNCLKFSFNDRNIFAIVFDDTQTHTHIHAN